MARPFHQMGDMQSLQYTLVYFPNLMQPTRQPVMGQQLLQQVVGEHFGPLPSCYSQPNLPSYGYLPQPPYSALPIVSSRISPQTLHQPGVPIVNSVGGPPPMLFPHHHQYASGLLYLLVPLMVEYPNLPRPASVPVLSSMGTSSNPLSPSSVISEHKSDTESVHLTLHTSSKEYASVAGREVSLMSKRSNRNSKSRKIDAELEKIQHLCSKCGKTFQRHYNLKSHMRTHSPERPFKCLECPKTFARSHDRKRHEHLHKGIKKFECQGFLKDGTTKWGCGKKFARSDALARHFRTETGWLCIKPLMDEAQGNSQFAGTYEVDPTIFPHHQNILPPLRNQ